MAVDRSEQILRGLLETADIHIDGGRAWDIRVRDRRFYGRVLSDVLLGLGESYMDGWWECDSIDQMIDRALCARLDEQITGDWKILAHVLAAKVTNQQRGRRAYAVGERHYDLGNDLYCAMLDSRLNYTCAYWKDARTLDEAQEAKLDLVCRKIGLRPGMRVLELGCGWGAFAKFAAERYGAQVLGVTVSKQQVELGRQRCAGLPVELRLQDYRLVGLEPSSGEQHAFDAVISIGIMEHVGYKNYRAYMQVADRCLKEGGVAFIHTIGGNTSTTITDPWNQKYIFPNSMLPSIQQLGAAMEGIFIMEDLHNIGPHYDPTLMAWHDNFEQAWPSLKDKYDERFHKMWRFYLLTSAGAFRARHQQLWQMVLTRKGTPQPDCRLV